MRADGDGDIIHAIFDGLLAGGDGELDQRVDSAVRVVDELERMVGGHARAPLRPLPRTAPNGDVHRRVTETSGRRGAGVAVRVGPVGLLGRLAGVEDRTPANEIGDRSDRHGLGRRGERRVGTGAQGPRIELEQACSDRSLLLGEVAPCSDCDGADPAAEGVDVNRCSRVPQRAVELVSYEQAIDLARLALAARLNGQESGDPGGDRGRARWCRRTR